MASRMTKVTMLWIRANDAQTTAYVGLPLFLPSFLPFFLSFFLSQTSGVALCASKPITSLRHP